MNEKNERLIMGILYICTNSLGIPDFIKKNTKEGIKHILISMFTLGIGYMIYFIIGIIKGANILTMTDEEYFAQKAKK